MKLKDLRIEDLHWAAGFLEGEGSFCRCGGTIVVTVSQVNKEPLNKLQKIIGGNFQYVERKNQNPKWSNYYRLNVYGEGAEIVMKMVFPIMSTKFKNKISEVLAWYASRPGRNFAKSGRKTCRKGLHQWNDENTIIDRGVRTCRLCKKASYLKRSLRKQIQVGLN